MNKRHMLGFCKIVSLDSDTENLYTIATQAVTSQYGKDYSYDIKEKCMGRSEREGSQIIIGKLRVTGSAGYIPVHVCVHMW